MDTNDKFKLLYKSNYGKKLLLKCYIENQNKNKKKNESFLSILWGKIKIKQPLIRKGRL
jgi:hypothetical protein